MQHQAPFSWFINKLNYTRTYIIVCFLFSLSLIPFTYEWIKNYYYENDKLNKYLEKVSAHEKMRLLFNQIQRHSFLVHEYLSKNSSNQAEIEALQTRINDSLKYVIGHEKTLHSLQLGPSDNKMDLSALEDRWRLLRQKNFELSPTVSNFLHFALLSDLANQLNYSQYQDQYVKSFLNEALFLKSSLLLIPSIQAQLSHFILTSQNMIKNGNHQSIQQSLLNFLADSLNSHAVNLENLLEAHRYDPQTQLEQELKRGLGEYASDIKNFVSFVTSHLTDTDRSDLSTPQLTHLSENILSMGNYVWDLTIQKSIQVLNEEKTYQFYRFWGVLLLSLLLMALSFYIGLFITNNVTKRLEQITKATDSFTNGDLSVRVPVLYQDEIARQSISFNRMAQKLEGIINNLYDLTDATTELSNGNWSARIHPQATENEFNKVTISFNKMAETFEAIIRRLHEVGITLTSSATEIAAASKEQESIIVQQEATTREIALAASEISSTAKEFANTMNEVSQSAEQTSALALNGKDSLSNMESIMRHMVEASTNIASKLSILNQKAGNVTGVITTITKVADQTNLLSLNASIEAEKAGEYGRSFAVIAREIRRLADQTAVATLDIEKIVSEIMSAISSSVMGVDDFTQEIRQGVGQVRNVSGQQTTIIEQVQAFTSRLELVNQGMQAQSTGAEQINEAITQLSQSAQQTTESIHHFHKTIEELNQTANELHSLIPSLHSAPSETQHSSFFTTEAPSYSSSSPTSITPLEELSHTSQKLKQIRGLLNPSQKDI